jgi:predicted RNase H-like HicB family nuclease
MGGRYQVELRVGRQEDGLWRVEVPGLQGCWVDAPTLSQAIGDIQEGIAMALDEYEEKGWKLPESVAPLAGEPTSAVVPVLIGEHTFTRSRASSSHGKQRPR